MDRLPYVTLLLRVRGNTGTERGRWNGGASSTPSSADLVKAAAADGTSGRTWIRPGHAAAVRHRRLDHRVGPPGGGGPADELADTLVTVTFDGLRKG